MTTNFPRFVGSLGILGRRNSGTIYTYIIIIIIIIINIIII